MQEARPVLHRCRELGYRASVDDQQGSAAAARLAAYHVEQPLQTLSLQHGVPAEIVEGVPNRVRGIKGEGLELVQQPTARLGQ